jgi:hypothetical protein
MGRDQRPLGLIGSKRTDSLAVGRAAYSLSVVMTELVGDLYRADDAPFGCTEVCIQASARAELEAQQ